MTDTAPQVGVMEQHLIDGGFVNPRLFAFARERDAAYADMLRRLDLAASVAAALRAIVNEADEFDDHDGKYGHITYSTLVESRKILAGWAPGRRWRHD